MKIRQTEYKKSSYDNMQIKFNGKNPDKTGLNRGDNHINSLLKLANVFADKHERKTGESNAKKFNKELRKNGLKFNKMKT